MSDLINISLGDASVVALLGYCVVFVGLVLLMWVVMLMGKAMVKKAKKAESVAAVAEPVNEPLKRRPARGSAGELKLYNTEPRDAAMIMAIVANSLGKPLNELRFISIKEVTDE